MDRERCPHSVVALAVVSRLIIFDMAVKPSWGDASLWIVLRAFGALAALLVWNGLNARLAAA
ncbi:MAG TPA: hypothetical protein VG144_02125, partial [Gaiellaceae bacterium]|nr:hypothetical protein [Gaiellaceae bacterium]